MQTATPTPTRGPGAVLAIIVYFSIFFACMAGNCPPPPCTSTADFNDDGDVATDADIEAFFRVLAGGHC